MKKYCTILLLSFAVFCFSQKIEYPEAKDGYKKVELKLLSKIHDKDYKIEIFVTFMSKVAQCMSVTSTVKLEREYLLENNRYVYYEVKNKNVQTLGLTNSDCGLKINKKIYNNPLLEEYHSTYPYIFYIPKNMEIEYRIWKVEPKYIQVN